MRSYFNGLLATPPGSAPYVSGVHALEVHDDGSGSALYAGGDLLAISGEYVPLGKWSGAAWSPVDIGVPPVPGVHSLPSVHALLSKGAELYVAGRVSTSGLGAWGSIDAYLSRITGPSTTDVKYITSLDTTGALVDSDVHALTVFEDAGQSDLDVHVGGMFRAHVDGGFATGRSIMELRGFSATGWEVLGTGVGPADGLPANLRSVYATIVFDDGLTGPRLYVGGNFTTAGVLTVPGIARWNGSAWAMAGTEPYPGATTAFAVFDDGNGPALYRALDTGALSRWDGVSWSTVATASGPIRALTIFDDGSNFGRALHVGGNFSSIGGASANSIARWNGTSWSALDAGVQKNAGGPWVPGDVYALETFDDGSGFGSALYVGGYFQRAGGEPADNIAAWGRCINVGTPFCFGDGTLPTACPCVPPNTVPNPPAAPGHGCANSLNLDGALLIATGTTVPDTVTFSIFVNATYVAFGLMLKGDGQAAAGVASADGIRCVDGQLIRFGPHFAGTNGAPQGYWTFPNAVQTNTVSFQTGQPSGQTAYYQFFYRSAAANFCNAATTNWSNGVWISWL